MPVQVPKVVLPEHALLVPTVLTAQVPMSSLLQVSNVVLPEHPLLVPPVLTAQVPMSAELQLAWEKVPVRDQALAQPALVPPGLTAQLEWAEPYVCSSRRPPCIDPEPVGHAPLPGGAVVPDWQVLWDGHTPGFVAIP